MRKRGGRGEEQQGVVLIAVLWVLLAISLIALSFSAAIRTEVDAARNVVDQKLGYYFARAGIEYGIYKVLESRLAFAEIQRLRQEGLEQPLPQVLSGSLQLSLADGEATLEVGDETGKINLNLAPAHLIYNLLIMVGIEGPLADVITDSIEDWRDPDDFHRPNGAESEYYQSLPHPYFPKNGPFDVPEELLLVRGVTPEHYYGLKGLTEEGERVEYYGLQKYFTTFTTINRINLNSAPIPVLAAVPGLDYQDAVHIYTLRQQGPLQDASEVLRQIPGLPTEVLGYFSTIRSDVYTLVSTGRRNGSQVQSRIRAVVRVDGMGPKGYTILYWNEANVEL